MNIPIYLLVAGSSQRTKDIRHKALLTLYDTSLIKHQINIAGSLSSKVIVITGSDSDEIIQHCKSLEHAILSKVTFIHCPIWQLGRSHSLSFLFKKAIENQESSVFLVHIDQPLSSDILKKLYQAYLKNSESDVFRPMYKNESGHPLLIRKTIFQNIAVLYQKPSITLKEIINKSRIQEISVKDNIILTDLNTPDDFKHFVKPEQHDS